MNKGQNRAAYVIVGVALAKRPIGDSPWPFVTLSFENLFVRVLLSH